MNSLFHPADSLLHRLPAHPKILATILFVAVVVAIPVGSWPALMVALGIALGTSLLGHLPPRLVIRRLTVELPFVVFAVALPFVALGERIHLGPVSMSRPGLVAGITLLFKATTGVAAAIALSGTTTPRDLLAGVERLHLPAPMVAIASFMVRYAGVVTDDLSRMRTARLARGFDGRRLRQLKAEAAGAGALFIRSYERGERVHRAMTARGYTGSMPALSSHGASGQDWLTALMLPVIALGSALAAGAWA